jgi:mono/diheme cytochrome c family protein
MLKDKSRHTGRSSQRKFTALFILISLFLYSVSLNAQVPADSAATVSTTDDLPLDPVLIDAGQTLFKNNCAVCHAVQNQLVGPALAGVYERQSIDWITAFVQNSQKVIQSGDPYAVQLYEQYNKTEMTSFDFSRDEVVAILTYIKDQTLNPPQAAATAETTSDASGATSSGLNISSGFLLTILIALVIILGLILFVLIMLVSTLTRFLQQRKGLDEAELEVLQQRFSFNNMVRSPAFVGGITFIFVAIMLKTVIDGLYSVGIQQDYSPTQPIAFSHKVHAGDFAIQCQYCHTGVTSSRSANIPSANICMNCHSAIVKVTGATEQSTEIQKIYDAVENNKPIEWVRIHNLPDLAYFNHAQHYNVGKIECQTCHGPIETMEVVKQYSNLTMGWCIDCHRTNVIQTDNGYYDKLVELHNQEHKDPMIVADIGGLECSKCHY